MKNTEKVECLDGIHITTMLESCIRMLTISQKCIITLKHIKGGKMNGIVEGYTNEQIQSMSKEDYVALCKRLSPPLTQDEMKALQMENKFYSAHESLKHFNGRGFTILNEIYEGEPREDIGIECSSSWIDTDEYTKPIAKSSRLFEIKFNADDKVITAEEEEINGYYIKTGQVLI